MIVAGRADARRGDAGEQAAERRRAEERHRVERHHSAAQTFLDDRLQDRVRRRHLRP